MICRNTRIIIKEGIFFRPSIRFPLYGNSIFFFFFYEKTRWDCSVYIYYTHEFFLYIILLHFVSIAVLYWNVCSARAAQRWRHFVVEIRLNWFLNDALAALGNNRQVRIIQICIGSITLMACCQIFEELFLSYYYTQTHTYTDKFIYKGYALYIYILLFRDRKKKETKKMSVFHCCIRYPRLLLLLFDTNKTYYWRRCF